MDAHGLSIRALIMTGSIAEGTPAPGLIAGFRAKQRLADKGYDHDALLKPARLQGMRSVIPPKIKIETRCANIIRRGTNSASVLKMRYCIAKGGVPWLPAMPKAPLHSLSLSTSGASTYRVVKN